MDRRFPWPLVIIWLLTGALGVVAVGTALDGHSTAVQSVLILEMALVWGAVWVATLVPRIRTLTLARIGVPLGLVVAIGTVITTKGAASSIAFSLGALGALVTLASPAMIDAFVDGSSYGPERRFGLRTPAVTAWVAVPLTWLVAVCGLLAMPFAVSRFWIGAILTASVWAIGVRWAVRSLHLPARRWVVFVPAGMVIADPLVLVDALLLPRRNIATLGPAFADTNAIDMTRGTLGLALQVDLTDPFEIPLRDLHSGEESALVADRLVFSVLRPGALLAQASERRVSVGETRADIPTCVNHGLDHNHEIDGGVEESQTAVALPRTRSSR